MAVLALLVFASALNAKILAALKIPALVHLQSVSAALASLLVALRKHVLVLLELANVQAATTSSESLAPRKLVHALPASANVMAVNKK